MLSKAHVLGVETAYVAGEDGEIPAKVVMDQSEVITTTFVCRQMAWDIRVKIVGVAVINIKAHANGVAQDYVVDKDGRISAMDVIRWSEVLGITPV